MRKYWMMISCTMLLLAAGCTAGHESSTAMHQQHAECLVCKEEADLACVDVTVDATTPKTTYDGKTYYFCSDHCRDKFTKSPEKYAKQ